MKDSFNTLDIARLGFEVLLEANWIRKASPSRRSGLGHRLAARDQGRAATLPAGSTIRTSRCSPAGAASRVVAGGMLYRADGVVGLSNVVADAAEPPPCGAIARACWRPRRSPRLPLVGYESGDELHAALDAGFEIGDPLRVWVKARDAR